MSTPICDFVRGYCESVLLRLHMPGHKGRGELGCEALDITEVPGADDLACPEGVILESEENTTELFGSRHSFYCTGGSSQCVKAMLHLAYLFRPEGTGNSSWPRATRTRASCTAAPCSASNRAGSIRRRERPCAPAQSRPRRLRGRSRRARDRLRFT